MSRWPYNTSAWQRLRAAKLSAQPVCEPCERRGRTVLAEAVDHIIEINKGGPAFPPLDALMSMCTSCHSVKTNAVKSGKGNRFRGCDVDGNPLDPDDEWHTAPHSGPHSGISADAASDSGDATMPASGHPCPAQAPWGFAGRQNPPSGPTGESNTDLVFANDLQQGDERWV